MPILFQGFFMCQYFPMKGRNEEQGRKSQANQFTTGTGIVPGGSCELAISDPFTVLQGTLCGGGVA